MKIIAAALLIATAYGQIYANNICVLNKAGFDLHWYEFDTRTAKIGPTTSNYPIDKT